MLKKSILMAEVGSKTAQEEGKNTAEMVKKLLDKGVDFLFLFNTKVNDEFGNTGAISGLKGVAISPIIDSLIEVLKEFKKIGLDTERLGKTIAEL